jgi:ribosome-associated protein
MPEWRDENTPGSSENPPSKSARKRQMLRLQAMGESLLTLSDRQLAHFPIEDQQLLSAIRECRQIRSNSARKRHLQLIGKLMRSVDTAPIEEALQSLHNTKQKSALAFHELEQLREDILAAGPVGVELAMTRFPAADRQQLRQLVLQHQREIQRQKPLAASRKLFLYLKELQENYGESD